MISIPEALKRRDKLRTATRDFFANRGYLEVETPILTQCPGTEVYLHYFATEWVDHISQKHPLFLRSSPELHMKRLLAHGIPCAFQLGPCFRNKGEFSPWHNPEFTMLEWYQKSQTYAGLIAETEDYLRQTAAAMASITGIDPKTVLPASFNKIKVFDAFAEYAGITLLDQDPDLAAKARAAGVISVREDDDFETAYFKTLIEKIEPAIMSMEGCILMDYPPSQAALAVVENGVAQRFEYYIGRVEICNGFYELTGEQANRERIGAALRERIKQGNEPVPEDENFYRDMALFTEPCAGNALGFDRWLTLLSGATDLAAILPFRSQVRFRDVKWGHPTVPIYHLTI
jgi:lysyl-tRNA synthetase class 2